MSVIDRLAAALADRYSLERELGAGGMATVYLAEDLKHKRKVAIKVLKPELAAVLGAERFVIEITTTAALQHPHILPLFDSGEADGFLYYVMPFIDGETLRAKLDRETQLSVEESVRITSDVASALHYAHTQGVVHRDIKPENILLHEGRPMVADFGIALALSAAAGGRMTETGMSLGTPHYMSPEQATAEKEITARSDVYSLGSVLYEMLTGNPPHVGASAQQIIMKIITTPAELVTVHRKSVPANVAAAVAKSLEKLPADRFDSAKAFAEALGNPTFTVLGTASAGAPSRASRGGRVGSLLGWAVAAVALAATGAMWMRPAPEQPFRRLDLSTGDAVPNIASDIAVSPDGSTLAMSATLNNERAIFVRDLDGDAEFRKLAGTETGLSPEFSPDGEWIVFRRHSDNSLVKVLASGGGAVTLVTGGEVNPFFPQWATPDRIIFTTPSLVYSIGVGGGEPTPLPKVTWGRISVLPDGSGILHSDGDVKLYDFASDSSYTLVPGGLAPKYVASGHLIYVASEGGLFAVKFNLAKHAVEGSPVRVLERIGAAGLARGYAISASGVLVQRDADGATSVGTNTLVIVDPGKGLDTLRLPAARRAKMRFSPDGRSLAMEVSKADLDTDIYSLDLVTGTYTQLTFEGDNDEAIWSPDGKRLLFDMRVKASPAGEDLHIKPADNSAAPRRLTMLGAQELSAAQWLSDTLVLFAAVSPGRGYDLFTTTTDSGSVPVPYLQTPANESEAHIAPDQRLIAYTSDEGGNQVWMRDFPVPQGKWSLSQGRGRAARWSPDGQYVYFWRNSQPLDSLFRVRIERTPNIVVRAPELVFAADVGDLSAWDLHPDGRRFIINIPATGGGAPTGAPAERYLILQNFFSELRRLTEAKPK